MGFVGNYAPRGLSPQMYGMPVIPAEGWVRHNGLSPLFLYPVAPHAPIASPSSTARATLTRANQLLLLCESLADGECKGNIAGYKALLYIVCNVCGWQTFP